MRLRNLHGHHKTLLVAAAIFIVPFVWITAAKAAPKPNNFPLQLQVGSSPACAKVGQVFTVVVFVFNSGNRAVTANIQVDPLNNNPYSFSLVKSAPALNAATQTFTDVTGKTTSWTNYAWQQAIKPGPPPAVFSITLKMPDWNIPQPPYTDPVTQITTYPPPPQPYPVWFNFFLTKVSKNGQPQGAMHSSGFNVPYCGQPVPAGSMK